MQKYPAETSGIQSYENLSPMRQPTPPYRVGLIRWPSDGSGIGEAIYHALEAQGHEPFYFSLGSDITTPVDVIFLFGPFGRFLNELGQIRAKLARQQPIFIFWNTEGLPDLRLPWPLMAKLSAVRSWLSNLRDTHHCRHYAPSLLARIDTSMIRFRHLGDFLYANQQGWIDVFADISAVYANLFETRGIPTLTAPFGGACDWYADLNVTRDIDVLWMGKRATGRRSKLLDQVRLELRQRGVEMYVVDNIERPFVFDDARTQLLNRTKITLNLLRTWYDENSLRICLAAANRSLIVSEPLLAHVPQYKAGKHYVTAPVEQLADQIMYYLEHENERQRIVEDAYQLVTHELTIANSVRSLMEETNRRRNGSFLTSLTAAKSIYT
ncbi:MAG: glycosyltransferase [Chloroflexi bacterium]|nr:glycosyltransferase [Chloroflexota bacterium]